MTKHKPKTGNGSGSPPIKGKGKGKDIARKGNGNGNGGGGGSGNGSGSGSGSGVGGGGGEGSVMTEPIDLKELPLCFPEFASVDHSKVVPRYSAVLKRSDQDGIGLEDIDTLQLELEALLASTVVRKRTLKEELLIISNVEKYRGQMRSGKKGGPGSPGKRGFGGKDERSTKKFKSLSGKPVDCGGGGSGGKVIIGIPKIKSESSSVPSFDPLQNEQIRPLAAEAAKPAVPKNETPNRFWAFVEPYCAPVQAEDIKLLEDLIKTHNDLSEYYRVPPLGQHYTQRWAMEDLENERLKSAANPNEDSSSSSSAAATAAAAAGAKKTNETETQKEGPAFGELTQRLVAGLMEENVMTSVEESIEAKNPTNANAITGEDKSNFIRSLNVTNSESLEARVRKELEEQGILDPNDPNPNKPNNAKPNPNANASPKPNNPISNTNLKSEPSANNIKNEMTADDGPDEILEELKKCQAELKSVSGHNLQQLKRLLKAAKEEMIRQELRSKLNFADQEVMEAYKRISIARSKKKIPSKKEREMAWKALKEREIILKQLESL